MCIRDRVCALALFLAYLLAQRLPLRKAGFYGTLVAAAVFMLTSWFAMGERREMLDDTQAVVMSLLSLIHISCWRDLPSRRGRRFRSSTAR